MSQEYKGSGGKGGGSPDIADVSGFSSERAEVVLGLCEGQVKANPSNLARKIFLNNTPIENDDGSKNFEDLDIAFLPGTNSQGTLPGNSGEEISTPTNVGVEVLEATPVTRSINNPEINSIRLRLAIRLQKQEDDGDISGESLTLKIYVKEGAGAFVLRVSQQIQGRYPDLTVFPYLIQVNPDVSDYTVRVEKEGSDSSDGTTRDLQWVTYEEVVQAQLTYPNTAILWLQYPPNLFRSAPQVTVSLDGSLAQIPITATVASDYGLDFAQTVWNGVFYTASEPNTDPVWLLWKYLVDPIWGLGIAEENIDRYAFYEASVYNNQIIADGFGTTERRFSFRGQLDVGGDGDDRYETARQIAATFAAKLYHNGTQYTIWQDRPTTANPRIVANADVVDGIFLGTTQDYSAIATACYVWRSDPDQEFQEAPEPVEYPAAINKFGYKLEEFRLLGETRRGGAVRAGRRVILNSLPSTSLGEIGQISFKMRSHALFFELGEIIQIADSARNNDRRSGLVVSATTTQITLDSPVNIGNNPQIYCVLSNLQTEVRIVSTGAGTHTVLSVSVPFSSAPLAQSTWQVIDDNTIVRSYRIVNITPDTDNGNLYEVSGKLYDANIYNEIENGWALTSYDTQSTIPVVIPVPQNVIGESLQIENNGITYSLSVRWSHAIKPNGDREPYVQTYAIEFKRGVNGVWGNRQVLSSLNGRWENIGSGTFYARVASIAIDNRYSGWVETSPITLDISTSNVWLLMMEDDLNI